MSLFMANDWTDYPVIHVSISVNESDPTGSDFGGTSNSNEHPYQGMDFYLAPLAVGGVGSLQQAEATYPGITASLLEGLKTWAQNYNWDANPPKFGYPPTSAQLSFGGLTATEYTESTSNVSPA